MGEKHPMTLPPNTLKDWDDVNQQLPAPMGSTGPPPPPPLGRQAPNMFEVGGTPMIGVNPPLNNAIERKALVGFCVDRASNTWAVHFYYISLKVPAVQVEVTSDESLPMALIDQANGAYKGILLAIPGHYNFHKDLIPVENVASIHHILKQIQPRFNS